MPSTTAQLPAWLATTIEAACHPNNLLRKLIDAEQIQAAIQQTHDKAEDKYPKITGVAYHARNQVWPITEAGIYKFVITTERGKEEVKVWIVPPDA